MIRTCVWCIAVSNPETVLLRSDHEDGAVGTRIVGTRIAYKQSGRLD